MIREHFEQVTLADAASGRRRHEQETLELQKFRLLCRPADLDAAESAGALLISSKPEQVKAVFDVLAPVDQIPQDEHVVRRAVESHAEYGLHFRDAMIVAAARRGGGGRILSEDLNPGQSYFGVTAENHIRQSSSPVKR